jgi:glycine/D-amino acid oxidase-like deaminating enzyme/nitrite reductase/ring-hydroxylating ferredoxin subunit
MEEKHVNPVITSGANKTYWIETVEPLTFEPLQSNMDCDVVIVGGGIAGLSVAYGLSLSGKKVIVIEDGNIGSGETGRTSAHLTAALDDRYYEIENLFGKDGAKMAAESHMAAIDFVEKAVERESIHCEFKRVPGYLFLDPSDKEDSLEKEFEATQKAGLHVRMLDSIPGFTSIKSKCLEFPNQAQFHPMKYIHGLAKAIIERGGRIFTKTHASKIDEKGIETENGIKVNAKFVVVATNTPVNNKFVMHLKQFPFRTYLIGALIKKDSLPKALWWDTGNYDVDSEIPPYHYIRTESYNDTHDILLVGGEDHATGLADAQEISEEERYNRLEAWLKSKINYEKIIYRWSGQVMEPVDAMGFIGHNPLDNENVFIVTGDSGNGLTHGSLAGILITDLINGKENPWESIYKPSRFKLKAITTWIKEFGGGFMDYLKLNPKHADEIPLSSIEAGTGKIIQLDKEKYGVYRDENNRLHFVSAECTHLQCTIKWNGEEKSWDCPCHGSRFTYDGKVLNGPANKDLFYCTQEKQPKKQQLAEK